MQELIKSTEVNGQKMFSARDLHEFLGSKQQMSDWLKARIKKYGFIENQDYITFSESYEKGRPSIEYALTLDMAKELAMVEGNAKGKEARQYFIECEKKLKSTAPLPIPKSQAELVLMIAQQNVEQERRMQELEQRQQLLEAKLNTSNSDYFSIMGYAQLQRRKVAFREAATIGKKATALSNKLGFPIETVPDARYGKVNIYALEVLEQVFSAPLNISI